MLLVWKAADAAVAVVDRDVDAINFIAEDKSSKEALKSAYLLKSLDINALIEGEIGVGKTTLARYILPDAAVIDAREIDDVSILDDFRDRVIITYFSESKRLEALVEKLEKTSLRVIATTRQISQMTAADHLFSAKISLHPLSERPGDVAQLAQNFWQEAAAVFHAPLETLEVIPTTLDLTQNAHSLRRSIYFLFLMENMNDRQLMQVMEGYLYKQIGSQDDYRKFLYLYEAPLIRASIGKFKSQLQVSKTMGLNRNTLRKKINEMKDYL